MAEVATDLVRHLRELAIGDLVEAWHDGRRYNPGRSCGPYPPWECSGFSTRVAERGSSLTLRRCSFG